MPGGDWNFADYMVANGAGGSGGENYSMYIVDAKRDLREFKYSDRETYKNLDKDDQIRGRDLPQETESQGTEC